MQQIDEQYQQDANPSVIVIGEADDETDGMLLRMSRVGR
jgi:hypothetical protein